MSTPLQPHPLLQIILYTSLFLLPHPSASVPRHSRLLLLSKTSKTPKAAQPTTFFQVTKPINLPKTKPCSYLLLRHDFGNSYFQPGFANYTPPTDCPATEFSTIVLELSSSCQGVQYDRIFGLWLGGVELLRSCTAEPFPNGTVWKVKKDITRYHSLLMSNQTLDLYLANRVDPAIGITGIYHVNVSVHFFPAKKKAGPGPRKWADLVLPISRNSPSDGLWFEIQNPNDIQIKEFGVPLNAYRAVLEIYVSFHGNDEFWYTSYPNGPFR